MPHGSVQTRLDISFPGKTRRQRAQSLVPARHRAGLDQSARWPGYWLSGDSRRVVVVALHLSISAGLRNSLVNSVTHVIDGE